MVFIKIGEYFDAEKSRYSKQDIFSKLKHEELKYVDRLETHIALGDYSYIFTVDESKMVGYYLKSILKYMEEPLCTFQLYPKFKKLCETLDQDPKQEATMIESLKELMWELDAVHVTTWKFLLRLWYLISTFQKINKVCQV